jgi:hypothetical protein
MLLIMPPQNLDPKDRLREALEFKKEHPEETDTTVARIFDRSQITRRKVAPARRRGGQNKLLQPYQVTAIQNYVREHVKSGFYPTKPMLFGAICHLLKTEVPPRPPPSKRWFQGFLKENVSLHVLKTKRISRKRVTAQDVEEVHTWFQKYERTIKEHNILPGNLWNFDETGFRVGCPKGEDVVVPIEVTEVHIALKYI